MLPDKTTVVLFTDSFPFRCYTEEVFVMPEIEALSKSFDRIILVPHRIVCEELPIDFDNVIVDTTMASAFSSRYRAARLSWLFQPWVLQQLPNVISETRNPGRMLSASFYLMNIRRSYSQIKKIISRYRLRPESTIFYTFWFDNVTDALSFFPEFKAVTRAHGHDIFDSEIKHRLRFIRRKSLANLRGVFCASDDGTRYMARSYPDFESKISTRRLGTNSPDGSAPVPTEDSDTLTLLSCARVAPEKRVELCLESAAAIASAFPFKKVHWIHIGDGPLMPSLKKRSEQTDILPPNLKIDLRGAIPNEEVHKIYRSTPVDWFMLLSRSEGLPISIVEAISYGVPVIATDVGGNAEIVTPETGILVPPQFNPALIAGELQPYISDYASYMELRADASKFWKENFEAKYLRENMARELSVLINKM